jgi:excisionase family DNA binding protein
MLKWNLHPPAYRYRNTNENLYTALSQYIQVDIIQIPIRRYEIMTSQRINKNTTTESEPDNGPYIVQLSPERKVRNYFELKKGKFFRTDTVAEILDIEPEVIRDLIRKKELSAIKIGKSYRIAESDLQEFLQARYTMKPKEKIEPDK